MSGPQIRSWRAEGVGVVGLGGGRMAGSRPRPLGDLNAAMRDLDLGSEAVRQLVEQRTLIGFNIAVEPGGRGELRILTRSLEHHRSGGGGADSPAGWDWRKIFELIFPTAAARPLPAWYLTGVELAQGLNCSRGHLKNLAARHFEIVRPARRGRGNTARVKLATVERWLQSRWQ